MIPEGWTATTLGEVSAVTGGKRLPKGRSLTSERTPHPYIRVSDMTERGIAVSGIQYLPNDIAPSLWRYKVEAGDILISVAGTLGLICRVPPELDGANLTENADRISGFKCDPDFLFYALLSESVQGMIEASRTTNAQSKLALDRIRGFRLLLPPLFEQRRIAEILSTWHQAILKVELLLANSRAQKKALMQSLLAGKKRLPGFSGEWITIRLGDAFAERTERGDDKLPLLSVTQADGVIYQSEAGRKNISSADQSNYKTVRAGDIAYNTMRMWQGASALSRLNGKVSPAYTIVTPRPDHDAQFYAYLFKSPSMIHVFERHSQGLVSDTWNLKYPHFSKIAVRIPSFDEQVAIRRLLQAADEEIKALKAQLAALHEEKSALMQQLLTGKRRVNLDQREAA